MSTAEEHPINGPLERLIDEWCERRELGPLSVLLPAFTSNNGLTDGWLEVMEALRTVRGNRSLPDAEQQEIGQLVVLVERMVYRN